jgi:hypothetical protein
LQPTSKAGESDGLSKAVADEGNRSESRFSLDRNRTGWGVDRPRRGQRQGNAISRQMAFLEGAWAGATSPSLTTLGARRGTMLIWRILLEWVAPSCLHLTWIFELDSARSRVGGSHF